MSEGEQLDINAVLEFYGARTQHRRTYMTNCVLHEDNTPSLSVNTEKSLWNCKSCSKAGDGFTLIMLKEGLRFDGARDFAATSIGLAVGGTGGGDERVRASRYTGSRTVARRSRANKGDRAYVPRWRRG